MRPNVVVAVLLVAVVSPLGRAADGRATAPSSEPAVTLSLDSASTAPAVKPSDARLARVTGWIRERAPGCPQDLNVLAAQRFLEDLQERHPDQLDRLLADDFPVREVESTLLQQVATQLKGSQWNDLREELARRRVEAVLAQQGSGKTAINADAASMMAKIKDSSQVQYRRLLDGRMEEDGLELLLKKLRGGDVPRSVPAGAETRLLTAAEIVSEFSRHNQVGSALQRLRAYTVEARLKTASGEEQHLLLFKMRPHRFRLVVQVAGSTRIVVAGDGNRYWEQAPGQETQIVPPDKIGTRRYFGEFLDPMFAEEGFSFGRLADDSSGGRRFYRITVRRSDGSHYIAQIDMEKFQEIGREEADGGSTQYSDFRQVAGVTIAFHEEATDREGRKGQLDIVRITPNPGLIEDIFEPDAQAGQGYFAVEQLLAEKPKPHS